MKVFSSSFEEVVLPEISLHDFILNVARKHPEHKAFIDIDTKFTVTCQDLVSFSENIAQHLVCDFNWKKGDVLGMFLPNHSMYPVCILGTLSCGGIVTLINPLNTEGELAKQLKDTKARILITFEQGLPVALKAVNGSNVSHVFVLGGKETNKEQDIEILPLEHLLMPVAQKKPIQVSINAKEDVALLPCSSGTTGLTKCVKLTHYNIVSNILQTPSNVVLEHQVHPKNEHLIAFLPFFHIYAIFIFVTAGIVNLNTTIVMPRFDLVKFLTAIQEYKPKRLQCVPPIILALAKQPIVEKFDLSSLICVACSAAPLAKDMAVDCLERLKKLTKNPNLVLWQGYGMTELSPLALAPSNDPIDLSSSGTLISNMKMRVVNIDTGKDCDVGEQGELVFSGPNLMQGYLNQDEATKFTIRDGWLFSGDIGYIDQRGRVYIVDRVKELIKYKGYQVPPAELEAVLLQHPAVADCAVIGVPDLEAGEIPKAFVVLKNKEDTTLKESDIMSFVEEKVSPQKKIRMVEFIDAIPKATSGKILRRILRDREKAKN